MEQKIFDIKKTGNVTVLKIIRDEITLYDNENFKKGLEEVINAGARKIILDLSGLKFISSVVLASLVFSKQKVRETDGRLKLAGLSGRVKDVFDMTDLHKIFEIYASEKEALESFSKG